jgi:hypothetical protein
MMRMAEQSERATMTEAGPAAGERALMRAVLEDAIRCLAGEIGPVRERPNLRGPCLDRRGGYPLGLRVRERLRPPRFDAGRLRGRLLGTRRCSPWRTDVRRARRTRVSRLPSTRSCR